MTCEEVRSRLHLYLDRELPAAEALSFESHLMDCASCRSEYEAQVAVIESVRAARPLYAASESSFLQANALVMQRRRHAAFRVWAIAASVLLVSLLAFSALIRHRASNDRFAMFAADSHLRYSRGSLPLDIQAAPPEQVAGWLSARLPFRLTLPNYPEQLGSVKRYSLVGARLLQYADEEVAFLAYRMGERPISLVIASSDRIAPGGGEVYQSGGLSFHMTAHKGLRMITWIDKGLSYALVSELDVSGAESCAICHSGAEEHKKFERLQPRL